MYSIFQKFIYVLLFSVGLVAAISTSEKALGSRDSATEPIPRNAVYVADIWHPEPNATSNGSHIGLLDLIQNPTNITHVIMFNLNVDYTPEINTTLASVDVHSPNYDWLRSDTKKLQAAGVKMMASSGGYGNKVFDRLNANFSDAYPHLLDGIKAFNFDGLDLDIELPTDQDFVLKLLNSLYTDMGPDFILTIAPVSQSLLGAVESISGNLNYTQLDSLATASDKPNGKLIDWYNGQFYAGGTPSDDQVTAYQQVIETGWDPSRIVLGLTTDNTDSSWQPIATYQATASTLKSKVDNFGGIVGYDYWNAGSSDKIPRWQWVEDIGQALFS